MKTTPELHRAIRLRWYYADREREILKMREWRAANPDKQRTAKKNWMAAHPEQEASIRRAGSSRRKARKRTAPGAGVSAADWRSICEEYGHRCAYCAAKVPLTVDHVIALSLGGAHDPENVVPACRPCNISKRTLSILLWVAHKW